MPAQESEALQRRRLVRLQCVGLVSNVDRYVSAPLLVALTSRFHAPLTAVAVVASGHLLGYGLSQLPWGALLARCGPLLTMRVALTGAALSAAAAAAAPSLGWLIAARVIGGALLGAAVPAALLYVGTRVPATARPNGLAAIVSANGLGIAVAVALAVVATSADAWWLAYAITAAALLACALGLNVLREQPPKPAPVSQGEASPSRAWSAPAAYRVARTLVLVLVEGALVVGAVMVLPTVADRAGLDRRVAALTLLVFGLTMALTGQLLSRWLLPFTLASRARLAAVLLAGLPLAGWAFPPLLALSILALLLGAAWSALHPVLQAAATASWPDRTPAVLALFVTALFVGGAAGSQALASVATSRGIVMFTVVCAAGGLLLAGIERGTRGMGRYREPMGHGRHDARDNEETT